MNVLLVGEESAGTQTLKLLVNSGHRLVGVMASPTRKSAGGLTVWQLAEKLGCRTWPAELVKDSTFAQLIEEERVDILLNVHSLFVIKKEIIEAPYFGSFNIHPGPLPRYAGLNAPCWAIYKGERTHGVTLHRMLAGIDTGPIAYQRLFEIDENETGFSVSAKCIKYGMEMIKQLLDTASIDPAEIPVIEQDLTRREYFGKGMPDDGWLDWLRTAREIHNFVRAADYSPFLSPWKHPRSMLGEQEVGFVKTSLTGQRCDAPPGTVGQSDRERAWVAASDEWVTVHRLLVDGNYLNSPGEMLKSGDRLQWTK